MKKVLLMSFMFLLTLTTCAFASELINNIDKDTKIMANDLVELINIDSISENIPKTKEALAHVLKRAREMGMKTSSYVNDTVGVVEIGSGNEIVAILAHCDVVDPGDLSKWNSNPFQGIIKDGVVYGRGAQDDKGGVISGLYTLKTLMEDGRPLKKKVQLILGTQEEVVWKDMEAFVKEQPLPDYGFSPDGSFPICNREKGYADMLVDFPIEKINTKIGNFEILSIKAGKAVNSVPATAEVILTGDLAKLQNAVNEVKFENDESVELSEKDGKIFLKASGVSSHSSKPQNGKNTIWTIAKVLSNVNLAPNGFDKLIKYINENLINGYYGEKFNLYNKETKLNGEEIDRTTVTPTVIKIVDGNVRMIINTRPTLVIKLGDVDREFKAKDKFYGSKTQMDEGPLEPLYVAADTPFIKTLRAAYKERCGNDPAPELKFGTSYAKAIPNFVAFGPLEQGAPSTGHSVNECFKISSLVNATKLYVTALENIVFTDKSFKR